MPEGLYVYCIIGTGEARNFGARVKRLSAEYSGSIQRKYVGLAPPYSFVSIVIKDEVAVGRNPRKEEE